MLNWLKIDNLALIESAAVEFHPGFNVVTGETGAGKSIFLGAVALIFGGRADKGALRSGCDRAEVAAGIAVPAGRLAAVAAVLDEAAIPFDAGDGELCLRRVIGKSGVRNFINDSAVTARKLRELGELLVDIHSANEHTTIVGRGRQLAMLDGFGALEPLRNECRAVWERRRELEAERGLAVARIPDEREARELELTVEEIAKVAPEPGEDEAVAARHRLAGNLKEVLAATGEAEALLTGGEAGAEALLQAVYRRLAVLERYDETGAGALTGMAALIQESLGDLASKIRDYAGSIELDPEEYRELEERQSALFTLKRRYGPSLERVLAVWRDAGERLALYGEGKALRVKYQEAIEAAAGELGERAAVLSRARRGAAKRLEEALLAKLRVLGFAKGEFSIVFEAVEPDADGADRIDMLFSANPGEAPRPLREVASSGELARLMLALKAVLAAADATPILIFDEVDVNLGGETAHRVGLELLELAKNHQVLAISHLAQVAVRGERHFAVAKDVSLEHAATRIGDLAAGERLDEVARLLGGGRAARQHAAELLERARTGEVDG